MQRIEADNHGGSSCAASHCFSPSSWQLLPSRIPHARSVARTVDRTHAAIVIATVAPTSTVGPTVAPTSTAGATTPGAVARVMFTSVGAR